MAAGAAAAHADFAEAQDGDDVASSGDAFAPDPAARRTYDELYALYRELHDAFGGVPGATADLGTAMKRLLAIRERVSAI